eukprot:XP_001707433.1 Hypothetical protein GL50803_31469 [Giardia lamblia ATCC 50803]
MAGTFRRRSAQRWMLNGPSARSLSRTSSSRLATAVFRTALITASLAVPAITLAKSSGVYDGAVRRRVPDIYDCQTKEYVLNPIKGVGQM